MGNYLKWLTVKGRIKAHVHPQLQFTKVCLPHTLTAQDKCSTKKQHRVKSRATKSREKETSVIEKRSSEGAQELDWTLREAWDTSNQTTHRRMCSTAPPMGSQYSHSDFNTEVVPLLHTCKLLLLLQTEVLNAHTLFQNYLFSSLFRYP